MTNGSTFLRLCRGLETMKGIESAAESFSAQLGDLRSVLSKLLHTSATSAN